MRLGLCASALALAFVAMPAQAAVYVVGISGTLTGSTATTLCLSGPGCLPGQSQQSSPFGSDFSRMLGALNLIQGDNSFSFGSPYAGGFFTGIINNSNGVLTGRDLAFSSQTCAPGIPTVGCQVTTARAATFAVSGGVPEPATWALMLLGFGVIGTAMRRRRATTITLRFAA